MINPTMATLVLGIIFGIWASLLTLFVYRLYSGKPKNDLAQIPSGMRFSIVRFNPFSDTGGQQSFVISLLDGGGNGILLTSLHGRGMTRIYAKSISAGKADQELSAEEKRALVRALDHKI